MGIPELDERGFLPVGVYQADPEEIKRRFGRFRTSDVRVHLCARLLGYLESLKYTGLVPSVIVDGSFVSDKERPSDVDLILVLKTDHDFAAIYPPWVESVLSARAVKKRLKFDVLVAAEGSPELFEYETFFQRVKDKPGETKGILRVQL